MANDLRHGLTQADLNRLRYVESGALSPDGRLAVYVRFETDAESEKDRSSLWVIDLGDKAERRLTAGQGRDSAPAFSPDGRTVAFLSDRAGKIQVFAIPIDGGEAVQITTLPQGAGGPPAWSPDGTRIAFSAGPQEEPRDRTKAYRVTRPVYRFDGLGYLDDVKQDVYVVDVVVGEARRLTDSPAMHTQPVWTPDGQGLIVTTAFGPGVISLDTQLRLLDLKGNATDVQHPRGLVTAANFAPDGRLVVVLSGQPTQTIGSKSDLFVGEAGAADFECRTAELPWQIGGGPQGDHPSPPPPPRVAFLPSGEAVMPVQIGGSTPLYRIALSGPEGHEPLTSGDQTCVLLAAAGGRVLYLASDFDGPADLYLLDGDREVRLTDLNREVLATVALPEPLHLETTGEDGARVEGWFLRPTQVDGTSPLPTVLYIHGGPHSAFGHDFHADMQLLAGAGFGVLLANHRGSTGYGDAFATVIKGDWGHLDYGDLMAIVDTAVAEGLADPERLGVCGLSGGGNLTCWIVGQTERFKAAVPENPVTNFQSMFGVQDIGIWFGTEETGGAPHEIPEVYTRMSPITCAHRCRTPTLLVQGEGDLRCPPEQSEQFYNALTQAGCPVEMLRLPSSPHAGAIFGPLFLRQAQNEALVEWMQRWLLG